MRVPVKSTRIPLILIVFIFTLSKSYKQPEYWSNLTMGVFRAQCLVLVPSVGTYSWFRYINILAQTSVRTLKLWNAPSGAFWWYLTHLKDFKVLPVGDTNCLAIFKRVSSNGVQKTAAAIDEFGKYDNYVILLFFLYWLTCVSCWLSCGGFPADLESSLSKIVCNFGLYQI